MYVPREIVYLVIVTPSNLAWSTTLTLWPFTTTGGSSTLFLAKDRRNSLHLSQLSWNLFALDQSPKQSTISWTLLVCCIGTTSDTVVCDLHISIGEHHGAKGSVNNHEDILRRVWLSENGRIENRLSSWLYLLVGLEIFTYWLKCYDRSSQNHFHQWLWPQYKCGRELRKQQQIGCYLVLAVQLAWHNHRIQSSQQY